MLCPSLCRTEHASRGRKGRKGAERRGGRWVGQRRGQKGKKDASNQIGNLDLVSGVPWPLLAAFTPACAHFYPFCSSRSWNERLFHHVFSIKGLSPGVCSALGMHPMTRGIHLSTRISMFIGEALKERSMRGLFYTHPPPTPENTLRGVGGVSKRGGGAPQGASKYPYGLDTRP